MEACPQFPLIYRWLAAALGQASRTEEARQALEKAIAIGAGTFDMYVRRRVPWHRPQRLQAYARRPAQGPAGGDSKVSHLCRGHPGWPYFIICGRRGSYFLYDFHNQVKSESRSVSIVNQLTIDLSYHCELLI